MGGLGPKKFSTFGPSDASRKKTIKFHLMQAIAFYSPSFCLSNRVWHEQIVLCTIVTDPNNFKCHGTIFAIFLHQKTHYFLERTHQNLTHRMHDATHCSIAVEWLTYGVTARGYLGVMDSWCPSIALNCENGTLGSATTESH